jgi:hypothetical protein
MARRNPYLRELEKIIRDPSPAMPTRRTAAEIESDIQKISDELKGALSNYERLCLIEDRQRLRKQLAAISSGNGTSGTST